MPTSIDNNFLLAVSRTAKTLQAFTVITLAVLLFPSLTHATTNLKSYEAEYKGKYKGMTLTLKRNFKRTANNSYSISNQAKNSLASFFESSQFKLFQDNRIQPTHYRYIAQYGPIERKQNLVFDWHKKQAYDTENRSKAPITLNQSMADKISFQVLLRQLVKQGKTGRVNIKLFNRGRIKNYTYNIQTNESIDTYAGKINAVLVQRVYRDKQDSQRIWFAKDKDYALVKFIQRENNTNYEISLSKFNYL